MHFYSPIISLVKYLPPFSDLVLHVCNKEKKEGKQFNIS